MRLKQGFPHMVAFSADRSRSPGRAVRTTLASRLSGVGTHAGAIAAAHVAAEHGGADGGRTRPLPARREAGIVIRIAQ